MKVIAYIQTDLPQKFGIPRQSGLAKGLKGRIIFEPEFRSMDAVKGLEDFDYIWLLWQFDVPQREGFTATVRPPRLGGNVHKGVFATRSPFRPNPIGLSSVHLEGIEQTAEGPVLHVSGIDLRDHTAIYDIKPYIPYADCHPEAKEGFTADTKEYRLQVDCPDDLLGKIAAEKQEALLELLSLDPRPSYHDDPQRKYGVSFAGYNVKFTVEKDILHVTGVD